MKTGLQKSQAPSLFTASIKTRFLIRRSHNHLLIATTSVPLFWEAGFSVEAGLKNPTISLRLCSKPRTGLSGRSLETYTWAHSFLTYGWTQLKVLPSVFRSYSFQKRNLWSSITRTHVVPSSRQRVKCFVRHQRQPPSPQASPE